MRGRRSKNWAHRLTRNAPRRVRSTERVTREVDSYPSRDTGRYVSGYRVYRDGSYREDFGADR